MRLQRSSFKRGIRRRWPVSAVLIVLMLLVQFRVQATSYDGVFRSQKGQDARMEFRETPDWMSLRIWSEVGVLGTERLQTDNDTALSTLWIHSIDGQPITPRQMGFLFGQWWEVAGTMKNGQPQYFWGASLMESGDPDSWFACDSVYALVSFRHRAGIHPEDGGEGSCMDAGTVFHADSDGPKGVSSTREGQSVLHGQHSDVLVTNRITASVESLELPGLNEITKWQYQGFAIHVPEPAGLTLAIGLLAGAWPGGRRQVFA